MQDQIELFYLGDESVPRGAVVTTIAEDEVACRVSFSTADGHVGGGEAVIQVAGSVTKWSRFTFSSYGTTTAGSREQVVAAASGSAHEGPVIPSYGLHALVLELARGAALKLDLQLLDESAPAPQVVSAAQLVRASTEDIQSPVQGRVRDCERVELTVAGRRTNTYWVREGVVVMSDWAGARSYALPASAAIGLRIALGRAASAGSAPVLT